MTKAVVSNLFLTSKTWRIFKKEMLDLGFRLNTIGCFKFVFIHRRLNFVVKVVYGGRDIEPSRNSKISYFYLYPDKKTYLKNFPDLESTKKYKLYFQPKVDCRCRKKAYEALMKEIKIAGARWYSDAHAGNVGMYKGIPMIFDY